MLATRRWQVGASDGVTRKNPQIGGISDGVTLGLAVAGLASRRTTHTFCVDLQLRDNMQSHNREVPRVGVAGLHDFACCGCDSLRKLRIGVGREDVRRLWDTIRSPRLLL